MQSQRSAWQQILPLVNKYIEFSKNATLPALQAESLTLFNQITRITNPGFRVVRVPEEEESKEPQEKPDAQLYEVTALLKQAQQACRDKAKSLQE
jgi:hypothetical protein